MRWSGTLVALLFTSWVTLGNSATAVGPDPVLLWPDGAPGAMGNEGKDKPDLRFYPAPQNKATGACVVVLPGGGYGALAFDHEGHQVAVWLNSIGVSAAVVKYRISPYRHPAPLQDAQRAIRHVRANADDLKIDPNRVGIMGFSAGGHLCSTVSTHFDNGDKDSDDPVARQSSRPDFSILCYPVISLMSDFTHKGSRRNLLGDDPDPELVKSLSNETQVTDQTPPTFIFHTAADKGVPVENALVYYMALQKHGVPSEMHIYQNGPHGVGLAPGDPVLKTWTDRLADWLKGNGFLEPTSRASVSGTIQINGEPLRWGSITFLPASHNAATAFGMISRGRFSLTGLEAPTVGEHSVSVVNLGDVVPYPTISDSNPIRAADAVRLNIVDGENNYALDLKD
ncbi:MAG: alpha/beta hydrolase [Planctomycetaceae bacterium]|nr:alpha/beta hydrolase [Planctomycetaceae bacterium]